MRAFTRRFLMHYGIYRRYPLGAASGPAQRVAYRPRLILLNVAVPRSAGRPFS